MSLIFQETLGFSFLFDGAWSFKIASNLDFKGVIFVPSKKPKDSYTGEGKKVI